MVQKPFDASTGTTVLLAATVQVAAAAAVVVPTHMHNHPSRLQQHNHGNHPLARPIPQLPQSQLGIVGARAARQVEAAAQDQSNSSGNAEARILLDVLSALVGTIASMRMNVRQKFMFIYLL